MRFNTLNALNVLNVLYLPDIHVGKTQLSAEGITFVIT